MEMEGPSINQVRFLKDSAMFVEAATTSVFWFSTEI